MGLTLTDEQIVDVLDYVESNHDANFGISWDTIGWAIEHVLPSNLNK
jgi:mono/diheme cytochrome c family protein